MAFFRVCEWCGANLDPGEKCDCQECQQEEKWIPVAPKKKERKFPKWEELGELLQARVAS